MTIENAGAVLIDAHLGDSICIDGACLTVTSLLGTAPHTSFTVGISPETLRRTNLGSLKQHSRVNLEPALLPTTRLGGHFLQGHVDTTATIIDKRADGNAVTFRLRPLNSSVMRYIVEKGFVALDGASLTVTQQGSDSDGRPWFEIMLISYTQDKIVTSVKAIGEEVNIEVDMVGKYVEKSVAGYFEGPEGRREMTTLESIVARIVEDKLRIA